MIGFHRPGVFRRNNPETDNGILTFDLNDIPKDKQSVIDKALEELEITMSSGALRDAVSNVAGALIMQRELYGESNFEYLEEIIDASRKDLGFHIGARERCGGDVEEATEYNMGLIKGIVKASYGEISKPDNALVPTAIPAAEKTIAA